MCTQELHKHVGHIDMFMCIYQFYTCIYGSHVPHVYISVYVCVSLCTHDVHMFVFIFRGGYIYVHMYICTHVLSRCMYMLTC